MSRHLRRSSVGALAAGIVAAALTVPFSGATSTWTPVTRGLGDKPEDILPTTVSTAQPVTVVSTVLDDDGRPVVTSRTATDRASAVQLVKTGQQAPNAVAVELDAEVHTIGVPTGSDPYRASQWDLAKIQAPAAWQKSTGAGVVVAVIDSGVDASHPDLAGQVLPGVDLVGGTSGVSTDPNGHGTHVAGTIAALTGNEVGVSGFAPDAKILPIRTQNANGSGLMSTVATGITYAADHGAQVINMSLGGGTQVSAVTNAIAYARSKGVVVVASAGNSRTSGSPISYPAADPGVIAVASTDSADNFSSFSNRGTYVDVAAPGSGILSTYPVALGSYGSMSGTSMASPHIAAVAALLKAFDTGLSPDRIQEAMETSAVDLGAAGKDADFGYGRVDAAAALIAAAAAPTTSPTIAPTTTAPTTAPTTKPTTAPTTKPTPTKTTKPTPTKTTPPPIVKVTPSITSDGVSQKVTYGTTIRTTFTFTVDGQPFAKRPAQICTADKNAAVFKCKAATTSVAGTVTLTRKVTAPYRVYAMSTATKTAEQASSATYSYTVQAVAGLVRKSAKAITFTLAGIDKQIAEVQKYDGQSWATVSTFRATSKYMINKPQAGGLYRVVVPDSALIIGTVTDTVQM